MWCNDEIKEETIETVEAEVGETAEKKKSEESGNGGDEFDVGTAVGTDTCPKTVQALKDYFANMEGDWIAKIEVLKENDAVRYLNGVLRLVLSDHERDLKGVDWGASICIVGTILYWDDENAAKEDYAFEMIFQTPDGTDDVEALKAVIVAMQAWVEEEVFPNARMSIDASDLLEDEEVQSYLKENGISGYIMSEAQCSEY